MRVSYCNKLKTCTASSTLKSAVSPIYSLGDAVLTTPFERNDILMTETQK